MEKTSSDNHARHGGVYFHHSLRHFACYCGAFHLLHWCVRTITTHWHTAMAGQGFVEQVEHHELALVL